MVQLLLPPLLFVAHDDSATTGEERNSGTDASNEVEASFVCAECVRLVDGLRKRATVCIVAPTNAQCRALQSIVSRLPERYHGSIVVAAIDDVIGREFDVVMVSTTHVLARGAKLAAGLGEAHAQLADALIVQNRHLGVAAGRHPPLARGRSGRAVIARQAVWVFGDTQTCVHGRHGAALADVWAPFAVHCQKINAFRTMSKSDLAACAHISPLTHALHGSACDFKTPAPPARVLATPQDEFHVWTVVATDGLLDDVEKCSNSAHLERVVTQLRRGQFSVRDRPFRKRGRAGRLFYASKLMPGEAVAWTVEVRRGRHTICLLSRVTQATLDDVFRRFEVAVLGMTPAYVDACADVIVTTEQAVFPKTDLHIAAKPSDNAACGLIGTASAKLFDVTAEPVLKAFAADGAQRPKLPYLLDVHQQQATDMSGTVVIIGRGGTGKTAVLARKLFNAYSAAVRRELLPPRQLFVSQSRGLVDQVRLEFEALVHSLHQIEGLDALAVDPAAAAILPRHGVCFRSVFDLFRTLDDLSDPLLRLFEDRSSAVRAELTRAAGATRYTEQSVVDIERFSRVYFPKAPDAVRLHFSAEFVFVEIMSVIKRGGSGESMSRADYLAADPCSPLTAVQRAALYDFYVKFEREKALRRDIDYPRIVEHLEGRLRPGLLPFEAIFLDEVQDLMPCHWRLLYAFKRPNDATQLVCSGDQAQTITAGTSFRFARLKDFLYDAWGHKAPAMVHLKVNYRTSWAVLQLANRVLDLVRFFFPDDIDGLTVEESAHGSWATQGVPRIFRDADAFAFLFQPPPPPLEAPVPAAPVPDDAPTSPAAEDDVSELIRRFGAISLEDNEQVKAADDGAEGAAAVEPAPPPPPMRELAAEKVILVRDRSHKEDVERQLHEWRVSGNVLTVLEAKGLEFDDVLLVDVLSSTGLGEQLRVLYNFTAAGRRPSASEQAHPTGIPEFDLRKHYALSQSLKELYVAVTRAKQRLLFIESDPQAGKMYMDVLGDVLKWTTVEAEPSLFSPSSCEGWAAKARQYEGAGLLPQAQRAYLKAHMDSDATRVEVLILLNDAERCAGTPEATGKQLAAARLLENLGELEEAASTLYACGQFDEAARLYDGVAGCELEVLQSLRAGKLYRRMLDALEAYEDRGLAPLEQETRDALLLEGARSMMTVTPADAVRCLRRASAAATDQVLAFLEERVVKAQPPVDAFEPPGPDSPAGVLVLEYGRRREMARGVAFLLRTRQLHVPGEAMLALVPGGGLDDDWVAARWDARLRVSEHVVRAHVKTMRLPPSAATENVAAEVRLAIVRTVHAVFGRFQDLLPKLAPVLTQIDKAWPRGLPRSHDAAAVEAHFYSLTALHAVAEASAMLRSKAFDVCAAAVELAESVLLPSGTARQVSLHLRPAPYVVAKIADELARAGAVELAMKVEEWARQPFAALKRMMNARMFDAVRAAEQTYGGDLLDSQHDEVNLYLAETLLKNGNVGEAINYVQRVRSGDAAIDWLEKRVRQPSARPAADWSPPPPALFDALLESYMQRRHFDRAIRFLRAIRKPQALESVLARAHGLLTPEQNEALWVARNTILVAWFQQLRPITAASRNAALDLMHLVPRQLVALKAQLPHVSPCVQETLDRWAKCWRDMLDTGTAAAAPVGSRAQQFAAAAIVAATLHLVAAGSVRLDPVPGSPVSFDGMLELTVYALWGVDSLGELQTAEYGWAAEHCDASWELLVQAAERAEATQSFRLAGHLFEFLGERKRAVECLLCHGDVMLALERLDHMATGLERLDSDRLYARLAERFVAQPQLGQAAALSVWRSCCSSIAAPGRGVDMTAFLASRLSGIDWLLAARLPLSRGVPIDTDEAFHVFYEDTLRDTVACLRPSMTPDDARGVEAALKRIVGAAAVAAPGTNEHEGGDRAPSPADAAYDRLAASTALAAITHATLALPRAFRRVPVLNAWLAKIVGRVARDYDVATAPALEEVQLLESHVAERWEPLVWFDDGSVPVGHNAGSRVVAAWLLRRCLLLRVLEAVEGVVRLPSALRLCLADSLLVSCGHYLALRGVAWGPADAPPTLELADYRTWSVSMCAEHAWHVLEASGWPESRSD